MIYIKRTLNFIALMLFLNSVVLCKSINISVILKIFIITFMSIFFIYYNIKPRKDDNTLTRLKILIGGYELILMSSACFAMELLAYIYCIFNDTNISITILIINAIASVLFIATMMINGFVRVFTTSSQLGVAIRVLLILLWWMPIVNIFILNKFCKIAKEEYIFSSNKRSINESREKEEICKTRYPILMVHGIFFRDWKNFNYWGRIPKELINNGANIFYGNQNSSSSIEQSANELKSRILNIMEESNCEKLNIIAHSKGGLDARYAISCLGMDKYVASLTTINTPHKGCNFAGKAMDKLSEKFISSVGRKYESIFKKLGDEQPDFFSGVSELTAEKCEELNEKMIDCEGILYQSVGSKMKSRFSSPFPLNVGYSIIKPLDGDNDGLVSTKSMEWGNFLGVLSTSKNKGISHGDMIDLMRKNIPEFDVCEFYVNLVKDLKEQGL